MRNKNKPNESFDAIGSNEDKPFWERKNLAELNEKEWESLCDGCGQCCLHKIEYVETGDIGISDVACKLLDLQTCQCSNYTKRQKYVDDCIKLDPFELGRMRWLPKTCAYRLIYEGKPLKWWHPLISKSNKTVHESGVSVRNKVIHEKDDVLIERRIKSWIKRR